MIVPSEEDPSFAADGSSPAFFSTDQYAGFAGLLQALDR
jgi:hypothetical protein